MHPLSATRCLVKTCLDSTLIRPPTASAINTRLPRHLARLSLRPYCSSFRRAFVFLSRSFQQPTPQTDHDHKPEDGKKSHISDKLQEVRTEKIWTIPNALTVSRILSCPVLGYAILYDGFYAATGLLIYASLTDLACVQFP